MDYASYIMEQEQMFLMDGSCNDPEQRLFKGIWISTLGKSYMHMHTNVDVYYQGHSIGIDKFERHFIRYHFIKGISREMISSKASQGIIDIIDIAYRPYPRHYKRLLMIYNGHFQRHS